MADELREQSLLLGGRLAAGKRVVGEVRSRMVGQHGKQGTAPKGRAESPVLPLVEFGPKPTGLAAVSIDAPAEFIPIDPLWYLKCAPWSPEDPEVLAGPQSLSGSSSKVEARWYDEDEGGVGPNGDYVIGTLR